MLEQQPNSIEQTLVQSLSSEQLQLVANWLEVEKLIRIKEGYRHSDLTWSLNWMVHKLRTLAQSQQAIDL
ncbi:hypothetical protein D0962_19120 [Leptolyngbyaceae cyanobacterium CCMR0082]|uniref:Uncharacterized protein n=1 Tax=Adonisia turfae CCMR0082 TaxID=2304604 RepID=A0A6M0S9X8_9CYAN|nr:hypothetical protein [Adonisia turfae]NEZ64873.1 hypothetical protein [Adonisia turfae CCMR0082]